MSGSTSGRSLRGAATAKAGTRTILTQRAALRLTRGTCTATTRLTLRNRRRVGRARTVTLTGRFPGNTALTPKTSRPATARIT
jgi:hypothetical protein